MLVKIEILDGEKLLESYTAPDGSWIQTDTIGSQHLPALLEVSEWKQYASGKWRKEVTVRFTPLLPPKIPAKLLALVNSRDKRWGRNGIEWMGAHRERSGGTALDRTRELQAFRYRLRDLPPPLDTDPETVEFCTLSEKRL